MEHPAITTVFPNRARLPWEFEKNGRVVKIMPPSPLSTMNFDLQLRAAIEGLGFLTDIRRDGRRTPSRPASWCA